MASLCHDLFCVVIDDTSKECLTVSSKQFEIFHKPTDEQALNLNNGISRSQRMKILIEYSRNIKAADFKNKEAHANGEICTGFILKTFGKLLLVVVLFLFVPFSASSFFLRA